ncbi:MAG: hypothetical protein PF574_04225 [Candidatus Delongbacteria bacterium]|jgi:tetratricopeptide (TPR) repeat protein|nr:hypothetical protein [Candidatus Delongbacteria bacterium]
MRNILISIIIAVTITAGTNYLLENLGFSILIAVIVGIIAFFILTKKTMKELEVLNEKAQKAIYSQKFDRAIRIYESGLELRKKSPFIAGQIYGMIGMLYFMRRDNKNAKPNLQKASSLNWVSKGMLGVIYMHEKNPVEMEKVFKNMISAGKKEGLAWSLYAYCLDKISKREEAIKILEEGNKKLKEVDDRIKSNILELRNGRRMRMKAFGDPWYQFMLENPPRKRMMQQASPSQGKFKKNAMYKG